MSGARRALTLSQRIELAERIRAKAAQGMTIQQVVDAMGLSRRQVDILILEFQIKFEVTGLRLKVNAKHRQDTEGEIAGAVERLRPHFAPVCSMQTIRRPNQVPAPYHYDMKFRVGAERNVPVQRLLEMAAEYA